MDREEKRMINCRSEQQRESRFWELLNQFFPGAESIGSYIGGEWLIGDGSDIELYNADNGELFYAYRDASLEIIPKLNEVTKIAQAKWRAMSAADRGRLIFQVGAKIRAVSAELSELEAIVGNKPIRDARGEVAKVAEMFEYYAGWSDKLHGEVIPVPTTHLNYVLYEPLGTVLQITPWNAPLFTAGWQIAPAITAGNAVILKPSELTPVTSLILAKLIEAVGIPKGLVNVVAGYGHTIGQMMIQRCHIEKVVFVGSPNTGEQIAVAAARKGIPAILELGGKSANIVFADADYEKALKGAQNAIFGSAGQSCVSGSRLLVERTIFEQFVNDLAATTNQFQVGNPLDEATQIGPIQNRKQYTHVCKMIAQALAEGAKIPNNNVESLPSSSGYYVYPTVLIGDNRMQCAQEEIFGPVVVAIPFDSEAEAIAIANESAFGLAGAVWCRDVAKAHRVADQVRAGTFWINGYKTIHVSSPFGGYGASGYGRSSGLEALRAYSQVKSIWVERAVEPLVNFGYGAQEKSS